MDRFEEVEIPVPWGVLCGKWWGSRDQQPILALHGWQENAGSFDNLVTLFPSSKSVFCIDLPGHGRSSHLPEGMFYYLVWDGVLVVRRLVKYFQWTNITIMGHSLGGAIGFLYAASFPDEVEKLISFDIVNPSVRKTSRIVDGTGKSIDKFLQLENSVTGRPCQYNEMINYVQAAYNGSLTRCSAEVLMRRGMVCSHDHLPSDQFPGSSSVPPRYSFSRDKRVQVASLGSLSIDLILEYASKIKCEYLNIKGNPGMIFDNPEHYHLVLDKIKETAKRYEFYEVEGTHHFHINTPEKILPYVISFLEK